MKTADLQGAALDYWVARAEGIAHADIFWRKGGDFWTWGHDYGYSPSTDWGQGGRLLEKHKLCVGEADGKWECCTADTDYKSSLWNMRRDSDGIEAEGDTPLQAICRAVVRAAFGDEVGEVAHG